MYDIIMPEKGKENPLNQKGKQAMKNYKVRELANGRFGVYECTDVYEILRKTFKTLAGANNWIKKNQ